MNNCWSQIGVWGDRSCSALTVEIHCHNCAVYRQVGLDLLARAEPDGYTAEWTALLALPLENQQQNQQRDQQPRRSVTIFRLGQEWLALPARLFHQVVAPSAVHALPHRRDPLLRGIVNVRGQLLPCVSLHELLKIAIAEPVQPEPVHSLTSDSTSAPLRSGQQGGYPRLVVVRRSRETWAFEVDELYGLHLCESEVLRNPPVLSNQSLASFTASIFPWRGQNVSDIDADKLFSALRQRAL